MQAAHDEPVAPGVEERDGEALVATGLLERVEPHEPDALECPAGLALDDRGTGRQLVELVGDLEDLVEMGAERRLDAPAGRSAGQPVEALLEAPDPAGRKDRLKQEKHDDDEEADDDRPEVWRKERVEVDRGPPNGIAAESSSRDSPPNRPSGLGRGSRSAIGCYPLAAADRRLERPLGAANIERFLNASWRFPPTAAKPAAAAPTRPLSALTRDEEARAAELEAQIVAEERSAEEASRRSKDRVREPGHVAPRGRSSAPLSVRAADEYAYVRRDVWRIARIGGTLIGVLAILHILINVLHVISI